MKPVLDILPTVADALLIYSNFDISVSTEFCRVSLDFLQNGFNEKLAAKAAAKLNAEKDSIADCIKATMVLFCECARLKSLCAVEIESQLKGLRFPSQLLSSFLPVFVEKRQILEKILAQNSSEMLPAYQDLKWRLDLAAAQRSCHSLAEPRLLLQLETSAAEKLNFSCDFSTLNHVTAELELALTELRSPEFRKLTRRL